MKERKWEDHACFGNERSIYKENQNFFLKFFIKGKRDNQRLLDLGCGNGEFTKKIAGHIGTNEIFGIEINKAKMAKGIIVKNADLNYRFPFSDETFDVISANQILEHVWNTDNFFRETNRILKKYGYVVISTPNLSSLHSIFFILLGQQTPVIQFTDKQVGNFLRGVKVYLPPHFKAFNMPALKDLSKYYGFKVERIQGFGFYFLPTLIQNLLSKILGRYAVFITIRIRKIKNL